MNVSSLADRLLLLRSRVARRVFMVFVLCAMVPLSTLAFFTYRQISSEFDRRAVEGLRQSSKFLALTVMERLTSLEGDLAVIAGELESRDRDDPLTIEQWRQRVGQRVSSLVEVRPDGSRVDHVGSVSAIPEFTDGQAAHLRNGQMLVWTHDRNDGSRGIFAAMRNNSPSATEATVVVEVQSDYLWGSDSTIAPQAAVVVLDDSNREMFSWNHEPVPTDAMGRARRDSESSGVFHWELDDTQFISGYWTLFMDSQFQLSWTFVNSEDRNQVLAATHGFRKIFLLVVLLSFWIVLLLVIGAVRKTIVPLEKLKDAADRIGERDLSVRVDLQTSDEFEALGRSFNNMAQALTVHVQSVEAMNRIGTALSASTDSSDLLRTVMRGAQQLLNADGAILHRVNRENGALSLFAARIDSLGVDAGPGSSEVTGPRRALGGVIDTALALRSVVAGAPTKVDDIYSTSNVEFSGFMAFDTSTGYRTRSFIGVPLRNHENDIVGTLELINARDRETGAPAAFSTGDQEMLESVASQLAVTLSKHQLLEQFRHLFEGLTELVAKAIDEKSPYTGGHCKRVPVLSMMLADAVCRTDVGDLREVSFSEDELYEIRIAALLHDCGKVATPVHVVDKATKLETIVDRIQTVETRFEVIKRDKEIELLRRVLGAGSGHGLEEQIDRELEDWKRAVAKDREFLRKCNTGTEFMPKQAQEEVRRISERYPWSPDEIEVPFLSDNEIMNLTITRGTLNDEEREIINKHAEITIRLLEDLPYPKNLRNVPAYSGAHHERMDGTGYPLGLKEADIAIQGRLIGLADVFEALTAKDRPYKKGKTLSESLEILAAMARSGHVNTDLFEVFLREKVYMHYADQYLDPEQIDAVDEDLLLRNCA